MLYTKTAARAKNSGVVTVLMVVTVKNIGILISVRMLKLILLLMHMLMLILMLMLVLALLCSIHIDYYLLDTRMVCIAFSWRQTYQLFFTLIKSLFQIMFDD